MSGIPNSTNPMAIAKETVAISKQVDSPMMQKAATWGLFATAAVTALAGMLHAIKSITRDFAPKPARQNHASPAPQPTTPHAESTPPATTVGSERSWVSKARLDTRHHATDRQGHGGR